MPEKKKLAVFDMDGTLFRNSLLIELHWKLIKEGVFPESVRAEVDQYYWAWVNRDGSYDDYLDKVIETYHQHIKGVPFEAIEKIAQEVVERQSSIVYVFTRDLIESLRETHTLLALSGSPKVMVSAFTKKWNFDHAIGTIFEIKDGLFTGEIDEIFVHRKEETLRKFMDEHGFSKEGSVGVGDTRSDVGLFNVVERAICINPEKELWEKAQKEDWEVYVERKNVIYQLK